jgi:hypothetical protein
MTGRTGFRPRNLDHRFFTKRRRLKFNLEVIAEVVTPLRTVALFLRAPTTTEKHIENIPKTVKPGFAKPAAHSGPKVRVIGGMTILIVRRPFLRVGKDGISLVGFFKFSLSLFRVGFIYIRMILAGQFPESLFYLIISRILGDSQHLIIIAFCHYLFLL